MTPSRAVSPMAQPPRGCTVTSLPASFVHAGFRRRCRRWPPSPPRAPRPPSRRSAGRRRPASSPRSRSSASSIGRRRRRGSSPGRSGCSGSRRSRRRARGSSISRAALLQEVGHAVGVAPHDACGGGQAGGDDRGEAPRDRPFLDDHPVLEPRLAACVGEAGDAGADGIRPSVSTSGLRCPKPIPLMGGRCCSRRRGSRRFP